MTTITDLSLFHIEADLAELLAIAEEPDLADDEVAAIEARINEYVSAEVRKVDKIAGAIRFCNAQYRIADAEAERLKNRAKAWERKEAAIREAALRAMRAFDVKALDTATNKLTRCGNGGLEPLEIFGDGDLLPDDVRTVTITIPLDQYRNLYANYRGIPIDGWDKELIRRKLAAGESVPGAALKPRGEHLRVR